METARSVHEAGQWINENFVVRLCAVLDAHRVTGQQIENNTQLPGWAELRLARKLRNVFAHGSGRCNPANSDHQKLRNEIIERFGLNPDECPEGWFPLPIEKVLSKLTQGCVDYVVALAATRHAETLGRRNPTTDLLWDAGRNRPRPGGIVRDMPHALPLPPPGFDALPVDEQIEYIQSLWDRIAVSVDQVPLQQWQQALLEERLSAHRRAPEDSQPWQDVIDRIQGRLHAGR